MVSIGRLPRPSCARGMHSWSQGRERKVKTVESIGGAHRWVLLGQAQDSGRVGQTGREGMKGWGGGGGRGRGGFVIM